MSGHGLTELRSIVLKAAGNPEPLGEGAPWFGYPPPPLKASPSELSIESTGHPRAWICTRGAGPTRLGCGGGKGIKGRRRLGFLRKRETAAAAGCGRRAQTDEWIGLRRGVGGAGTRAVLSTGWAGYRKISPPVDRPKNFVSRLVSNQPNSKNFGLGRNCW